MRLDRRVCLITGGGSGIGAATCRLFAREGGRVAVMDRDGERAQAVAADIRDAGGEAVAIQGDVAVAEDIRRMHEETRTELGPVDVLVNNAGYGVYATVPETLPETWDRLLAVNLTGTFLACREIIPDMAARGGGVIVNVASVVASVGIRNRAAYCASKGGMVALTRAMALDHVDQGIRVNAVAPGTIDSPYFTKNILAERSDGPAVVAALKARQAMGRMGRAEEVAYAVLYLACAESSFCTGSVLTVDGGWTAQ